MHSPILGFALVFIAAIAGGALAVPLKKRRVFELENIYIPSTLVMMVSSFPSSWRRWLSAGGIRQCVSQACKPWGRAWPTESGWGVGAVLFGYGVTMAGMSVGFATVIGHQYCHRLSASIPGQVACRSSYAGRFNRPLRHCRMRGRCCGLRPGRDVARKAGWRGRPTAPHGRGARGLRRFRCP